jgi:hypothetical protein
VEGVSESHCDTLNIELDYSEIIDRYNQAEEIRKEAEAIATHEKLHKAYQNHPLQWYLKSYPEWTTKATEQSYIDSNGFSFVLTTILEHLGRKTEATITYNDRGQYELSVNYETIKRSKVAETVQKAFNSYRFDRVQSIDNKINQEHIRDKNLATVQKAIDFDIVNKKFTHHRDRGRGSSYDYYKYQHTLKTAKYDSDVLFIRFTAKVKKQTVTIDSLNAGELTYDQLNRIVAILKEETR